MTWKTEGIVLVGSWVPRASLTLDRGYVLLSYCCLLAMNLTQCLFLDSVFGLLRLLLLCAAWVTSV